PIVVEVPEDHPFWIASKGVRRALAGRRAASRPVFLVRKGLLPPPPGDERDVAWAATWSTAAAEKIDLTLHNVVGLLPGTDKKDEYVVVSAHYDHIGTGNPVNGDGIYNGADDDATGTTAVVLLAEELAKLPAPRRSILFVCFSGEEKGLLGSKAFGERPPVPREQIVANLNIEMIGRPLEGNEGKAWITGSGYSDFAAIVGAGLGRAGVELVDFEMANQLFAQSDNYSLARHGIVAHSISAGSLHKDYHRPSDEVGKLDIPHMAKIITGLREALLELANRDAAPQWTEAGKKVMERRRR
ncbi:MAG: M28 family peptidase, partial [Planctomycetes bacterium]|nr:M28 family peptidase [Planctomycetota bacterium]